MPVSSSNTPNTDITRPASRQLTMLNPLGLYDPSANGYSHVAMIAPGAGLVCVAGQGGERADGSLPDSFEGQVRQALDNLRVALAAAGSQVRLVAKLTVLVVDHSEARLRVLAAEVERAWGDAPKPACTLIPVPRLALDGMLFEVEALALAEAPGAV
ncbi:RidA family protein [Cupriavidus basilensis]|uniref:RidA family protein n=1 Tax=Cupriavidus basilensis TaxID=68895 RepID=A0ABT6B197_9BURK|nr:RidA family protein [Cupriavidus basilensis]MDF3838664.1 RidA family protein [Cupriavidus basilensis]